jgi:hypothetical protein
MSTRTKPEPCPDIATHTPSPTGYLAWHAWADEMSKTHRSTRCPGCGLYKIWKPKTMEATR